ncbi:MAG: hypothetical protein NT033_02070 [Candidatus Omnitrophica bacterium]|nr:hypothetical protein [Candidatus Omnitrophota bacterium]
MSAEEVKAAAPEEKQTNCASCSKPIKRLKRYYRNGKFYCTKKCWKNSKKPKEEKNE